MAKKKKVTKKVNKPKKKEIRVSDLVETSEKGISTNVQDLSAWGAPQLSASDIEIPRIKVMQAMSDLVSDGAAQVGDFVETLGNKKLGDLESGMEIIPFHMEKFWIVTKPTGGRSEFIRKEVRDATNEDLPFEFEEDGVELERTKVSSFYVLLPSDLAEGNALPHVIDFSRSSFRAGKKLGTQMYFKNIRGGLIPASYHMIVKAIKQKNDQGTFIVMDVEVGQKSTDKEVEEAFQWVQTINAGKAKVQEDEIPF